MNTSLDNPLQPEPTQALAWRQSTIRVLLCNSRAPRAHACGMGPLSRPGRTRFGRDNGPNLLWLWLRRIRLLVIVIGLSHFAVLRADEPEARGSRVSFNRDVRPILSDKCFRCHGADQHTREADLRLDLKSSAVADRDGHRAITPGSPEESELFRRVTSDDESLRMPPVDEPLQLSAQEITLLRLWIEQGAQYERHWSFIPPQRPARPDLPATNNSWPRGAIDEFVSARLETETLRPSTEADRATLIRRVTLDLTGLPPSLPEVDAFLADESPQAYEHVVDRLLKSPRYGEHMARYWLDAARYADTNGFFTDDERSMWQWRDWVIRAFNDNMPFDQFTIEQLAGDLLPEATLQQRIATGFNRNHMTTHETGVIDEEYRVEMVVDRLETTSTVWLGLTVGCARCHDHKFDPISQREFYELFAFFNRGPEKGNTGGPGNSLPVLEVQIPELQSRLKELQQATESASDELKKLEPEISAAQSAWEPTVLDELVEPSTDGLLLQLNMEPEQLRGTGVDLTAVEFLPGLLGTAAKFDGEAVIELGDQAGFERTDAFTLAAWVNPANSPACVIAKNDDLNSMRGFDVIVRKGKAIVHLIHKWNGNAIEVVAQTPVRSGQWQHLGVTYDGSSRAAGVRIYFDGQPQPIDIRHDSLNGTIQTEQPLRIGRRSTSSALVGMIDEVHVYDRVLADEEVESLAMTLRLRGILTTLETERTPIDQQKLRDLFLMQPAGAQFQPFVARLADLQEQHRELASHMTTTMVMQEMAEPRDTYFLMRGQYDQPGDKVTAQVPASLPGFPDGTPNDRLGFARWLVGPAHPLTARVTVNRFWQQLYGTGIVKTAEDFGSQGAWPSHPELLDWLAVEFMESGWDVKHVLRLMVTSATYRQASCASNELRERDPDNRLLARGPRLRLGAETLRDNALAISGLLREKLGGPSVKPYQPPGLWEAVTYDGDLSYTQDHGDSLYRRSLYTFWKRQSPPPGMLAFDAPTRETCTVQRPRTNTPLQALALLNDPTYVEAARALAERLLTEVDGSESDRVQFAFRLATARLAEADEAEALLDVFRQQLVVYQQDLRIAEELLRVGESARNPNLSVSEHAAWTIVASMILNLDETVTRQ